MLVHFFSSPPCSPRMVSISSFMKAHGIWEPCNGHLSPLGQYASLLPCLMMESLQQEKQNLWRVFEGHCTKWVSSSLPRQFVHFNKGVPSAVSSAPSLAPLLELDTWSGRLPCGVPGPVFAEEGLDVGRPGLLSAFPPPGPPPSCPGIFCCIIPIP